MRSLNLKFHKPLKKKIRLNSSKSESNRLLIIKYLSEEKIKIKNISNANDTILLENLLLKNSNSLWDVKDSGTTMRFLTSYIAINKKNIILTGSKRMKKRPISILVESLKSIGCKIEYIEKDGYPPIIINEKISQKNNYIEIKGNISSQYISSILMIAPKLKKGISLKILEPFYSKPYVMMTLKLMKKFGISNKFENNIITVKNQKYKEGTYTVEADWSAASYWYSIVAINKNINNLKLKGLRKDSLQGDQIISEIMISFGVSTKYVKDGIILNKNKTHISYQEIDFKNCPDLAQSILVIASKKKINLKIIGVESLKIKETNRLLAMKTELKKIGINFYNNKNEWFLDTSKYKLSDKISISTYKDHRMAMAFSPLASECDLTIQDPDVVNKSYPNFWKDLKNVGYKVN